MIERFNERHLSFATTTAFTDDELLEYNQKYIQIDTLSDSLNLAQCGVIIDTAKVISNEQMQSLEIHQKFYSRAGMDKFLGVKLYHDDECYGYFSLARDFNSTNFDSHSVANLQLLIPHIQRSVLIGKELMKKETIIAGYESALEQLATTNILLNKSGQVITHTVSAAPFLTQRTNIQCTYPIRLPTANDTKALHMEIRKALLSRYESNPTFIPFMLDTQEYKAVVFPWKPAYNRDTQFIDDVACIVMILPSRSPTGSIIQTTFNLTNAETKVADQLIEGKVAKEVASTLFTSEANVRFHIKNILRKAECKNQNQLLALIHKKLCLHAF